MGQQIKNFSNLYLIDPPLSYGRVNFSNFVNILEAIGLSIPYNSFDIVKSYFFSKGYDTNVFSTFIGSFLFDFGKIGTVAFLSIISSVICYFSAVKTARKVYLSDLLLLLLYYQIVSWGVFYFRQYSMNYYLLAVILLYGLFRLSRGNRGALVGPLEESNEDSH